MQTSESSEVGESASESRRAQADVFEPPDADGKRFGAGTGVGPTGSGYRATPRTVAEFLGAEPGDKVEDAVVHGYVRSVRKLKSDRFLNIGDGSTVKHLQAIAPKSIAGELRVGAAVRLRGSWVPSEQREQFQTHELKVNEVEVLGPSDPGNYPLQNKYQTLEFLRTLPHLRSRIPLNSALLRLRSDATVALTRFFAERGYTQTHPPLITSSDCEGAGEVFSLSAGKPKAAAQPGAKDEEAKNRKGEEEGVSGPRKKASEAPDTFFRSPKYLTVSTQLHLEALAQSVGNVWTLSPTFRAEKSDTSRHMAEFYMVEAEMSFVEDMDAVMDLAEDMVRGVVERLSSESSAAREILSAAQRVTGDAESLIGPADELQARWDGLGAGAPRWPRIRYAEAIELLQAAEASGEAQFEHTPAWGVSLQAEHEKYLAMAPPALLPLQLALPAGDRSHGRLLRPARARRVRDRRGSMREHRLGPLLAAMERNGMPAPSAKPGRSTSNLDWYVDLRRWGSPPHGGFGLGFDRLLVYLVGAQNVKDMVAFPRWFGRCDC
ncbi:unnamed protein product [Parascedosporium putredinis]|uniref:Aminoacyl-transfer RNA synthetases class-II family profile domain-containing protein n=1 Tax=Parascedosporium putredinis TaxID=1442378 RepID=A0A9P1MD99_9PEZI|nr:unnamed protein product [Parascedosporium putredinis]CAI8000052.1 unnamed protein product [Parascedosporium putredinis]